MGLRFRKSINIGRFRINLSKSGVGYSYGVKGLRVTKTAKGKKRITASIPGTGLSYVKELDDENGVPEPVFNQRDDEENANENRGKSGIFKILLIALLILIAILLIIIIENVGGRYGAF